MGEVTPGPPLLQAGLLSSAPGEAACSLLGALIGDRGVGTPALLLPATELLVVCCSSLPWLLESFPSAGTGMARISLDIQSSHESCMNYKCRQYNCFLDLQIEEICSAGDGEIGKLAATRREIEETSREKNY